MVPEGWKVQSLDSLGQDNRPAVKAGPFGSTLKKDVYVLSGYKVYGQEQVIAGDASVGDYYIDEDKFSSLESCSVQPGDILISLVGTIGKVLLLDEHSEPGVINPRLLRVSLSPKEVDSLFFRYFLESEKTTHTLLSWAQGGTMGVLNAQMIKALQVSTPPLPEQKKIAQILSTWDQAITATEHLLENSQQRKKGLMQQLLTGKKRLPGFEGEWKKIELGDALDYQQPTPFLVTSTEYSDDYPTPVLTAGKSFFLGYTNEDFGIYSEGLPVIIFDDFTTASQFVDFPFKAKSSAMKILTSMPGYSIRYIFEAMQMVRFAVGGHQRHWISIFSNLVIPCPSFEEQKAISKVLSLADKEVSSLKARLSALKQEKKALMQQLLTGKRRVNVEAEAA